MTEPFHLGGTGEPLVLLHGFTDTWRAWTPVLPMLERHHTVFAPTLPGHYGGEPFPEGARLSIPSSLDMIERQLDAHGIERAHFAGSSLGGWLSLELAGRGRALSVVGVCPAGCWEYGPAPRFVLRELVTRPQRVSASAAYGMFLGAANCTVALDALRLAASGDMFGALPAIGCPVRIAYGTRDRLIRWPEHYSMIRRQLPEADFVPLEGLGHLAMWDDPELVARTILEVSAPDRVAQMAAA